MNVQTNGAQTSGKLISAWGNHICKVNLSWIHFEVKPSQPILLGLSVALNLPYRKTAVAVEIDKSSRNLVRSEL